MVNVDQCWSMVVDVDQCWPMLDNVDQCWSTLAMLINVAQRWSVLVSVDQCWPIWCCSEQQNHWKIIDRSLIFKVFDVCGGWKVMKIDRIKEKAAQNLRKSSSEARISHNSGVGDSPNSLVRRERESWDGVLVVPGFPKIIGVTAGCLISGARGCPKYLTS